MFLAVDTSNNISSICCFKNSTFYYLETKNSSEDIPPMLVKLINEKKISSNQIKAIFCSLGPGSFTGIKSGISFAKVFAYALNCPIYGFNSLNIVAKDFTEKNTNFNNIVATVNAYGNSVYTQAYNKKLKTLSLIKKIPCTELNSFAKEFNADIAGYGETKSENKSYCNSLALAKLALENKSKLNEFTNVTPFYLQNPYKKLNNKTT